MTRDLRIAITLLVLLNLVFVQLTGAVGAAWLVPMQLATALAPAFVRFHDRRWWRGAWNVGVLTIFAVLVRDTLTTGPRHMLEDGLVLAAFCQVHLLNVLRRQQNADLLFFNSFLIALVTSFFCQDLGFSIVFLGYAFGFVVTLELAADRGRRRTVQVVRAATGRALALVVVTGVAFAVLPRDFTREGLVDEHALSGLVRSTSGFTDEIDPNRSTRTSVSDRIVMLVHVDQGERTDVPAHWRGAVLEWFDARGWRTVRRTRHDDPTALPWNTLGSGHYRRRGEPRTRVRVECEDPGLRTLFAPLESIEFSVPADASPDLVYPRADGTIARRPTATSSGNAVTYGLAFGDTAPTSGNASGSALQPLLTIDANRAEIVPPVLHGLVADALRGLPDDAAQEQLVERCRAFLEGRFDYALPGQSGAAAGLASFLAGDGGGHCELFATSLALMLRLRGVPCRVATGYLVGEWDDTRHAFVVRERHAHAWVEVYDRRTATWSAVDATPATAVVAAGSTGLVESGITALRSVWEQITTFDARRRDALFAWLASGFARLARWAAHEPVVACAILTLLGAFVTLLRRRIRERRRDPVRIYERALRRAALRRLAHETPRELLERARRTPGVRPERLADLEDATQLHETARFASLVRPATPGPVPGS